MSRDGTYADYVCLQMLCKMLNTGVHVVHAQTTDIMVCPDNPMKLVLGYLPDITITKICLFKYTEILPPKNENFQIKNSDIFHISAEKIDCGYSLGPLRRGGSNEYPQSMCLCKNKKHNVYPCKPLFYYIKVGF